MSGESPMPLRAIHNVASPSPDQSDTPVGDRDKRPKIQLCLELRNKELNKKKSTKKAANHEPVLEVAVMYIKNLPRRTLSGQGAFVKLRIMPGEVIHSTELKMDKKNEEKVDFVEVFDFPLKKDELLKGKKMEVMVCDRKMTRNCLIYGRAEVDIEDVQIGKPVCQWYSLKSLV